MFCLARIISFFRIDEKTSSKIVLIQDENHLNDKLPRLDIRYFFFKYRENCHILTVFLYFPSSIMARELVSQAKMSKGQNFSQIVKKCYNFCQKFLILIVSSVRTPNFQMFQIEILLYVKISKLR